MIQTSTITQKGQVTIPFFIRQKMALESGSKVTFILEGEKIIVSPLPSFFDFKGSVASKKQFNIEEMREQAKHHLASSYGNHS